MDKYQVFIPFGKYAGKSLGFILDSDPSYIRWMAGTDKMPGDWSEACKRLLENKSLDGLKLPISQTKTIKSQMWIASKDRVGVIFDFDQVFLDRFKFEIDGRRWDKEAKCWTFPKPQIIKAIELFGKENITATDEIKTLYKEEIARKSDLDQMRDKEDSQLREKLNKKLKIPLFGYQAADIEWLVRAGGRALVANQPGLGKTLTSIAFSELKEVKTLIICPKSVMIGWCREIHRATGKNATTWFSDGKSGRIDAQYHVINYDIISKVQDDLRKANFDLLICDEATYIKNRKTLRTKAILGDYKQRRKYPGIKTKYVLFLTGTPVLNRPVEAFVLLNFLDSGRFNNFYQFIQKYGGWKGEPPRNLDDLHSRTKDLVVRRLQKDILKDLPPKLRNILYVDLTKHEFEEYSNLLKQLFRKWNILGKPSVAEMHEIQNYLLKKKLPRLIEVIDELIEQDLSVLIYSCYKAPLFELQKHYGEQSVILHGEMNTTERQVSIDALKNKEAKIGLFSLGAGGMGIDGLQYGIHTVIFMDRYWNAGLHQQAEDRSFRMGQTKQVTAYYMTVVNSVDEYMETILREKQEMADKIVDGKVINLDPNKSFFKEFVSILKKNYTPDFKKINVELTEEPSLEISE